MLVEILAREAIRNQILLTIQVKVPATCCGIKTTYIELIANITAMCMLLPYLLNNELAGLKSLLLVVVLEISHFLLGSLIQLLVGEYHLHPGSCLIVIMSIHIIIGQ